MKRYIGIDVHTESCTFAVMGSTGRRLQEAKLETNGKVLKDFVRRIAGERYVCFEECTHAEWLYELLEPVAEEVVVVLAERNPGHKSDSADAWKLANDICRGNIRRAVYKAPDRFSALRSAAKAYQATQKDMVRAKTRLNSLYRSRGVPRVSSEIYNPERRADWLKRLPAVYRSRAEILSAQLDGLVSSHKRAHDWLLEEGQRLPIVNLVASAPGFGPVRAPLLVASVVSPHRFRTRRQFWSYCGLGIVTRSSSDWMRTAEGGWERRSRPQTRGLNRNRHPVLKDIFAGAATTVIRQMPEHPLTQAYQRQLDAGTKPNLARLTVARRIAGAVLAMWKTQEKYDPSKQRRPD